MGIVSETRFLLYNFASDLNRLVLEFPFQDPGMSWAETIAVELERGDYDRDIDAPHYHATLKADTHLAEKDSYEPHEDDEGQTGTRGWGTSYRSVSRPCFDSSGQAQSGS